MKRLRWQLIIIFLTGLVVGMLLLGEQPEVAPLIRPEPVQGGIYTEALVGSLQRLNPLLDFYNPVDRDVNRLLYSAMIHFDERGFAQPDVAESWGVSKDGTIYNFTLRSGVRWHDDHPLTSEDVLFTIEMMRDGDGIVPEDLRSFWKEVDVKSLSETALQFQLPSPFAPFLDYLTFGILPRHLLGDVTFKQMVSSSFNLQPVGSGPYRFNKLLVEGGQIQGVTVSVFNGYYGKKPFIEQINFRYYPDSGQALVAYQEGTVQGISSLTRDVLPNALSLPNLAIYSGRLPEISMVLLNLKNPDVPFFQDVRVRQALMMGVNRQWIINNHLQGQAVITDVPVLPGTWAYFQGLKPIVFDVGAAQSALKEAGFVASEDASAVRKKDNKPLKFNLLYPEGALYKAIAESIQKNWVSLNIDVSIEAVPYDQLVNERLEQRNYQAALVTLNLARTPDPDPYPFWDQAQSTGGQNYSQWEHRKASEYLELARVSIDIAERERLYHNFQVIFSQELPALPLFYPVYSYAIDRQVKGVRVGPLFDTSDRLANAREWYLETRLPSSSTVSPAAQKGTAVFQSTPALNMVTATPLGSQPPTQVK